MMKLEILELLVIILLFAFVLWKFTISPLLRYGPFLSKAGVSWPSCLPPPIGYVPIPPKSPEEFARMAINICYSNREKIPYTWRAARPMLIVNNPEIIEQLLKSPQLIEKDPIYRMLMTWLETGLATSGGDKWRYRRKLLTPAFHFSILKNYFNTIRQQTAILTDIIKVKAVKGEAFDVRDILIHFTLDVICEAAMGKCPNAQKEPTRNVYLDASETLKELTFPRAIRPYLWFDWVYKLTADGRRYNDASRVFDKVTEEVIAARRVERSNTSFGEGVEPSKVLENSGLERRLPFLDLLLDKFDESMIDTAGVREEVKTFMFGGHDTTSNILAWSLQCIGEYSEEAQVKIHLELDNVFPCESKGQLNSLQAPREITFEDLSKLNYLERVIKEVLRLYPPVSAFLRKVTTDTACKINGEDLVIPEGAIILISPYVLHRDPEIYTNPESFDPDRFELENVQNRHPFAYIPFSAGPRNCLGQKYAMMELKTCLAQILRRFRVVAIKPRASIRIDMIAILQPRDPVVLKFIPR